MGKIPYEELREALGATDVSWPQLLADVQRLKHEQSKRDQRLTDAEDMLVIAQRDRDRGQEALSYRARQISYALGIEDESTTKQVQVIKVLADRANRLYAELDTLRQRYAVETSPLAEVPPYQPLVPPEHEGDVASRMPTERRFWELERRLTDLERLANQPGGPR